MATPNGNNSAALIKILFDQVSTPPTFSLPKQAAVRQSRGPSPIGTGKVKLGYEQGGGGLYK